MDLFNTQCSQSIFSLDATICPRKRAKNVTTGEGLRCANRHSNRAHWPIKVIIIIFSKIIKISKNHVSISKLGAFDHTSSILKKKIIFSLNIKVFKNHASICKLGAFGHASFIFKKGDHHHNLLIKTNISRLKKKKKNQAFISKLGAFSSAL